MPTRTTLEVCEAAMTVKTPMPDTAKTGTPRQQSAARLDGVCPRFVALEADRASQCKDRSGITCIQMGANDGVFQDQWRWSASVGPVDGTERSPCMGKTVEKSCPTGCVSWPKRKRATMPKVLAKNGKDPIAVSLGKRGDSRSGGRRS